MKGANQGALSPISSAEAYAVPRMVRTVAFIRNLLGAAAVEIAGTVGQRCSVIDRLRLFLRSPDHRYLRCSLQRFVAAQFWEIDMNKAEKAPDFILPAVQMVALDRLGEKSAVIIIFFDARGSAFCMKRLQAFQAILSEMERKNVQVLGISVDDELGITAKWASEIGVTFPLLSDLGGKVCDSYGLLNKEKRASERALVIIKKGKIVFKKIVTGTEVPPDIRHFI